MVLVVDQTLVMVSRSQGRVFSGSAQPPQMSTTGSPCRKTATEAPTSAPESIWSESVRRTAFETRLAGSVHLCHGDPLPLLPFVFGPTERTY